MPIPSVTDFENAKVDVDDLADIVNGSTTVTTRLGGDKLSVDQALSQIIVGEVTVYSAATTYTEIEEWVEFNSAVYRPLPSELPIGPEAFDGNKWAIAQGGANDASEIDYDGNANVAQKLNNLDVDDYTALRALTVAQLVDNDSVNVAYRTTEFDGGGGRFVWSTTDLSTEVTADTQSGIYVAPNSDATGASGAWVRADVVKIYASFFGSKEDWDGATGTDDSISEQAAIDYCIANEKNLVKSGISLIGTSLKYNRVVDGNSAVVTVPGDAVVDGNGNDYYFVISGGGYAKNTAGLIFDTDLTNSDATLPCVQLIRWNRVRFESLNSSDAAYVMSPKILRCIFSACDFRKIKCVNSPTQLMQSVYFVDGCQARRWTGVFFSSKNANFDLKYDAGCLMEAGGNGFDLDFPVGCSFTGTIEGMDTYAIKYVGGYALTISDGYYEFNGDGEVAGTTIDGSDGTGLDASENVTITGNYFSGDSDTSKAQIKWGTNVTAQSGGNLCTTTLHEFLTDSRVNSRGDYSRTALSSNDSTVYQNIRNEIQIGHVLRAESQYLYGSIHYSAFVGGRGAFTYWKPINNGSLSSGGFHMDENGDLITDSDFRQNPSSSISPNENGEVVMELTNNTTLTIKAKGSDGTVRSGTVTLS